MNKLILLLLFPINIFAQCSGYIIEELFINKVPVVCSLPNGTINEIASAPPDYAYLSNNGYCQSIGPTKNISVCYSFISPGTDISLNAGYSSTGCSTVSFSGFTLFTNNCVSIVGTGLTFTGLTSGNTYIWCFNASCTGPGPGFTSVCPYVINTSPLPIEYTNFNCNTINEYISINWETLSEINSLSTEIYKSNNCINWSKIGNVRNLNKPNKYSFNDYNLYESNNYYRLKFIDNDGQYKYSNIINCNFNVNSNNVYFTDLLGRSVDINSSPKGKYIRYLIIENKIFTNIIIKN